jgi:hypothetical protein
MPLTSKQTNPNKCQAAGLQLPFLSFLFGSVRRSSPSAPLQYLRRFPGTKRGYPHQRFRRRFSIREDENQSLAIVHDVWLPSGLAAAPSAMTACVPSADGDLGRREMSVIVRW